MRHVPRHAESPVASAFEWPKHFKPACISPTSGCRQSHKVRRRGGSLVNQHSDRRVRFFHPRWAVVYHRPWRFRRHQRRVRWIVMVVPAYQHCCRPSNYCSLKLREFQCNLTHEVNSFGGQFAATVAWPWPQVRKCAQPRQLRNKRSRCKYRHRLRYWRRLRRKDPCCPGICLWFR